MRKYLFLAAFLVLGVAVDGKRSPLYGGTEGTAFSDGQSQGIVKMKIWSGEVVDGIQVQSDQGGAHVWSDFHGTKTNIHEISFNYPDEYIYKISGNAGRNQWSKNGLNKLVIHTNNSKTGALKTYPYGTTKNTPEFNSAGGKVVGFWGYATSSTYFRGIGVYFQDPCVSPTPPPPPPSPSPPPPTAACVAYEWCPCCWNDSGCSQGSCCGAGESCNPTGFCEPKSLFNLQ